MLKSKLSEKELENLKLSEEELEELKSSIVRLYREEMTYYLAGVSLFCAMLEVLPFLYEIFTGIDVRASLRIALED